MIYTVPTTTIAFLACLACTSELLHLLMQVSLGSEE